uniref:NFX1-type zinc finger-containing protein 1-like n=1 Tax=Callorhinchus milii TaxID=7868 RepID=A0A4W3JZ43_CALMI|eukprot:gi/632945075/ref/XP_007887854.1/ PREDICTED: NFX1-type zinc finger-containing protein 1-like [Callorhinchus milii]
MASSRSYSNQSRKQSRDLTCKDEDMAAYFGHPFLIGQQSRGHASGNSQPNRHRSQDRSFGGSSQYLAVFQQSESLQRIQGHSRLDDQSQAQQGHNFGNQSGHRGGHQSGHRGGHQSGHRGGHQSGHKGGHQSGHRGGHQTGNRGGHQSGHRGGHPSGIRGYAERTQGRGQCQKRGQKGEPHLGLQSHQVFYNTQFPPTTHVHSGNPRLHSSFTDLLSLSRGSLENETQRHHQERGRQPYRQALGSANTDGDQENSSKQRSRSQVCEKPELNDNRKTKRENKRGQSVPRVPRRLGKGALLELSGKNPSDIVMKLAAPGSGLKEFLDQNEINNDSIVLLLEIFMTAIKCRSNRQNLQYLLGTVKDSPFVKITLPRFIVSIHTEVTIEKHLERFKHLAYILKLLTEIISVYPKSGFMEVSLLATLVESAMNHQESFGIPIDVETKKSLENLQQMVQLLQEKKREKALNSDNYNFFTDPAIEDFRLISIYPTYEDIHLIEKPFVRPNIVTGKYPDVVTYLDTHFRLLREDFVRPLREGISELLAYEDKDLKKRQINDIRIYFDAQISAPLCTQNGILYQVHFNMKLLKSIKWENSKRLLYGSLVCLSKDRFKNMLFATVANRNIEELKKGLITIIFTEDSRLKLADVKPGDLFLMVETSAYFEAYRHVLEGLKEIEADDFPMQKYIVQCHPEVSEPEYIKHGSFTYTLQPLIEEQALKDLRRPHNAISSGDGLLDYGMRLHEPPNILMKNLLDFTKWPSKEELTFDASQMRAVQLALTKELAIIQGPPGTGKTYLGLKVVKTLLANINVWQATGAAPILVVCYTNHALDQFMEGIHKFLKTDLIRVGGRSTSEIISKFSLKEIRKCKNFRKSQPGHLRAMYASLTQEKYDFQERIEISTAQFETSAQAILHLIILQEYIAPHHLEQLKKMSSEVKVKSTVILEWLGIGSVINPEEAAEVDLIDLTDSTTTDGDNEEDKNEEDGDDELIQVAGEAEILQAERMIDDDDLLNEIQRAQARVVAIQKRFQTYSLEDQTETETADPDVWQVPKNMKKRMKAMAKRELQQSDFMSEDEAEQILNIWQLKLHHRWRLYRLWLSKYQKDIRFKILEYENEYQGVINRLAELRNQEDMNLLRQAKVVGMTTTGAAKYRRVLHDLRPKIVIVEEAAEVLEAHIVTTLTSACEHLILIGDHQQLRPSATVYELAKHFNLEVSLFERLINMNVQYVRLDYQHRMRPEIAELLTPHIYDKLENHESVRLYENIKGVSTNLYFIEHLQHEDEIREGKSFQNSHEASFVESLCHYFIQQEYDPSQITVLTTYSGQLFCLRKKMPKSKFNGVRVCVVDKYQGEENDIVILSLVRSNFEGRAGFLKIANRICVALSRAKKGLFCIGNMTMLAKVPLWGKIVDTLRRNGRVGPALKLCCQNHPKTISLVSTAVDFDQVPEGGCKQPCDFRLDCGHVCTRVCHPYDMEHKTYKCNRECQKTLCDQKHKCPKLCGDPCGKCRVKVIKVIPQCGHEQEVQCSQAPATFSCQIPCSKTLDCGHQCTRPCGEPCTVKCSEQVSTVLECGHTRQVMCYWQKEAEMRGEPLLCFKECRVKLQCGHICNGNCFDCAQGQLHTACRTPCKRLLVCSHECREPCTKECPPCTQPCENRCIHSKCSRKCGQLCIPCMEPCEWVCLHHSCTKLCHQPCNRQPCNKPCRQMLGCGHPCIGLCGEPCPNKCRFCNESEVTEIFFGTEDDPEAKFIQLEDCQHIFEVTGFDSWMQEDKADEAVIKLKVCPLCSTPIRRNLRYGSVIKKTLTEIEMVKTKIVGDEEYLETCRKQLDQFLKEEKKMLIYFPMETESLKQQLAEQNPNLHLLLLLGHQSNLLSKVAELKSKADQLLQVQKMKIQGETNLCAKWITKPRVFFADQELSDIQFVLSHLECLTDVYFIQSLIHKQGSLLELKTQCKINDLLRVLQDKEKRVEPWVQESIDQLKKEFLLPKGKISEREKLMVVHATKLTQGHWYKCRNGHIYAIGNCGMAMETGVCPECHTTIGGTNCQLLSDNLVASEMIRTDSSEFLDFY